MLKPTLTYLAGWNKVDTDGTAPNAEQAADWQKIVSCLEVFVYETHAKRQQITTRDKFVSLHRSGFRQSSSAALRNV